MMSDLEDALRRLLTVRAECGAAPLEPALTSAEEVAAALDALGLEACEEIVTWYSVLGRGSLVFPYYNDGLLDGVDLYRDLTAIAGDFADQPGPVSNCVDWFPLAASGLVVWVRPSDGARPVAQRSEVMDFRYPPCTGGLASVVHIWADRFESGVYNVRDDGEPWIDDRYFTAPDELMAAHGL